MTHSLWHEQLAHQTRRRAPVSDKWNGVFCSLSKRGQINQPCVWALAQKWETSCDIWLERAHFLVSCRASSTRSLAGYKFISGAHALSLSVTPCVILMLLSSILAAVINSPCDKITHTTRTVKLASFCPRPRRVNLTKCRNTFGCENPFDLVPWWYKASAYYFNLKLITPRIQHNKHL